MIKKKLNFIFYFKKQTQDGLRITGVSVCFDILITGLIITTSDTVLMRCGELEKSLRRVLDDGLVLK